MAKSTRKTTNEQEFQGQVVEWMNAFVSTRGISWLDKATQEKPGRHSGKRNDLVLWHDRPAHTAFLELELKTPTTSITDPALFHDALTKAQHWDAPLFAIWNMQAAELYVTPSKGAAPNVTPIFSGRSAVKVSSVEDWLQKPAARALQALLTAVLEAAIDYQLNRPAPVGIDAEVFVSRLEEAIGQLRRLTYRDLHQAANADKALRGKLKAIAAAQGFAGFVDDVDFAIAGQIGYRLVGQVLFYFALRRKNESLPEMQIDPRIGLEPQLRRYWDQVRRFDYEALYGPTDIEALVPISKDAGRVILELIAALQHYDWGSLRDDVLGTVFERLIPREEQVLLGQFYTPKPVADLLVSLVLDGNSPLVLDPGCGSGTFLMSAYDYQAKAQGRAHSEILPTLWGFDLSPFATELAAINLYRQDFSSFDNFPRVVPGSFFDRKVGEKVAFPPAKPNKLAGFKKTDVPIPLFDAIVANPPYLRSQNQDDLDARYKNTLFASAAAAGVAAPAKSDLFAFFLFHASRFLKEGGRVGFVTPVSWMSSDYGTVIQQFLGSGLHLVAVVTSEVESFFSQVDVNTVLFVAEKPVDGRARQRAKFITLKRPIAEMIPPTSSYWADLLSFASHIEGLAQDDENSEMRVKLFKVGEKELSFGSNWARHLRAPLSYYELFDADA